MLNYGLSVLLCAASRGIRCLSSSVSSLSRRRMLRRIVFQIFWIRLLIGTLFPDPFYILRKGLRTYCYIFRAALRYAVHDSLVTAAFSGLFLLKMANLFPAELDLGAITVQVEQLAQLLSDVAAERYVQQSFIPFLCDDIVLDYRFF